ncbi:MAG: hypothetical protein WCE79_26720 [Xanthobacteraceae bacterium]
MSSWDVQSLSERFLRLADQTERRAEECRQRVPRSSGHKWFHDEALAEFSVYHRLHGRTFLETPQALVSELHSMKKLKLTTGAYDPEVFERRRLQTIDDLLAEFEPQLT